jgi:glycosyltransferase involved in cell wall biosynthesis
VRILVLCSDTGVRIGDGKGAALHLQAITSAFAALGHETEVVGVAANPNGPLEAWDVPQHLVPHPGRAQGRLRELRKRAVVELVEARGHEAAVRLRPDLVYERLSLFGTAGLRVAATSGIRLVVEINALLSREEASWRGLHDPELARAAESQVLEGADLRVAVSEEVAAEVRPFAGGRPLIVVPNGVDVDLFRDRPDRARARAELGLPASARLLCFTGSLRPWHGLDAAIDATAVLPNDVHLVVAGDGMVRPELDRRAHDLGLDGRVHWLGQVAHRRIPQVLAACDVALAPYPAMPEFSFSPLKLYEYLAAGIPVVASSIGQIQHALDGGRWGCLAAPGDPGALAAGIAEVLQDPAAAATRAEAARAFALAEHGWASRAQQVLTAVSRLPAGARHAMAH